MMRQIPAIKQHKMKIEDEEYTFTFLSNACTSASILRRMPSSMSRSVPVLATRISINFCTKTINQDSKGEEIACEMPDTTEVTQSNSRQLKTPTSTKPLARYEH